MVDPLLRPCACSPPPGGVHFRCLKASLQTQQRWWADLACSKCRWWYVGPAAIPLAEAALCDAERMHGVDHEETAMALTSLSRTLRGAAAAAASGQKEASLQVSLGERRKMTLQRILSIKERVYGSADESLLPHLDELAELFGSWGDNDAKTGIMERALSIKRSKEDESGARRSRVLGRLNDALHRHIPTDEHGLTEAAIDAAHSEACRRLDARFPDSKLPDGRACIGPELEEVDSEDDLGFQEDVVAMSVDA